MENYKKSRLYYNNAFRTEIWIIPENRFWKCKKLFRQCLCHNQKTLGSLDSMFGDAKKIYGTIAPAIKDLAPAQAQGGLAMLEKM